MKTINLTASIDWLSLSGSSDLETVRGLLSDMAVGPGEATNPTKWYARSEVFPHSNIRFQWDHVTRPDRWLISIPGSGCQFYGEKLPRVIRDLSQETDCHATRIDCAVDVQTFIGSSFEPYMDEVKANAGARGPGMRSNYGVKFEALESESGTTFNFGSRTSDKFVRLYDKGAEQGAGWWTWLRYELEIKGKSAEAVWPKLASTDNHAAFAQSYARGAVPKFEELNPEFARLFFVGQPSRPEVDHQMAALDEWIESMKKMCFGRIAYASEMTGVPAEEIIRKLGLLDAKPTANHVRHAGFLTALQARVYDGIDS